MDDRPLGDPEAPASDGDVPSASAGDARDLPVRRLFFLQVVVWNLVLLATSLGLMFVYFEGDLATGGWLVGAGIVLALYGMYRWPRGNGRAGVFR